jgi:anaerobic sulfite reductase subunit C
MDLNVKKVKKNAWRITKKRGLTAIRIRIPGGYLKVEFLDLIKQIAQQYGNGTAHMTTRQGFEIPDIRFEDMPAVNQLIQPLIDGFDINQEEAGAGYPAAGTRNISACIGNKVCPFANYNTTAFAQRIEKAIYPHDLHFKVALTGCPNDCMKVRMHDFGIMGMTEPQYHPERCVACDACVRNCKKKATGVLRMENYKIVREAEHCIGCGECVLNCPTGAWTRSPRKYYRLTLLGRTGKKNPRLGEDFIRWVDEGSIIKIIKNTYAYVAKYIDLEAPGGKEHIGYIVDRTGFAEYKKWALEDVELDEKAIMNDVIYWSGVKY